ncbi:MAG: DUF1848 domain-containing protein [Desulfobacterales bacterium]|nr:DUF1848 domain-containing protein [Desulfobacterales bacterium]
MNTSNQIVISASRRTDIPAFYMDWFMTQLEKGVFEVTNPYNQRVSIVPVTSDIVHTIVFWSKNFGPFIKGGFDKKLTSKGFNLFFNFTINSESQELEPRVPPLKDRLNQLDYLSNRFDPRSINWRFDPVCFYARGNGEIKDNLNEFQTISSKAAEVGIKRCVTSFMDSYPKIKKRLSSMPDFSFMEPHIENKIEILLNMEKQLLEKKIQLSTCCEKELLEALPETTTIKKNACIPNDLLMEIYGGNISLQTDKGQRIKNGCGCKVSVDIGSYQLHPCYHNCLFCYANPGSTQKTDVRNL